MFYIGICDDEEIYRKRIKGLCEKYFAEHPQEYKCLEFVSGEEFLTFKEHKIHLLFLDIELDGMNGIEVLSRLENDGNVWRVVFISSHDEMVFSVFGLKTLGFEKKPARYEKVAKWISIALRENKEEVIYEYSTGYEKGYFTQDKIYYLMADGSYTHIYLQNKKHVLSERLKLWENKLQAAPFVRIHKSYLINMEHVKSWQTDTVILTNGEELALGRQYKNTAKERYLHFLGDVVRGRM